MSEEIVSAGASATPPAIRTPPPTARENVSQKNRRGFVRRRPRGKVKVLCYKGDLDLGPNLASGLGDISESGVLLLLKVGLEKGQNVTLLLEGREHLRPVRTHGTIAWCVPMEGGAFRAGVKLDSYLRYKDILKIT